MAASVRKMVGVCEDSSSSDDEALRRCQEAVWEARGDRKTDGDTSVQQSKRFVVSKHEHDGNELQVTEGFRTHVAKKLGTLLDSCISETRTETSSRVESANQDDDDDDDDDEDDEGFRLFSTSVPGQTAEEPPAPARRRPAASSSDSDSEMDTRLKEAAVSVRDLLPSFSSAPSEEPPCCDTPKKKKKKKKEVEEEESCVVKKRKKRKPTGGERDSAASPLNAQSSGEQNGSSEPQRVKAKRKKKKKKKREGDAEEEALD